MGIHALHTVDKSQNRNNSRPQTVDNSVDGVDRYANIHPAADGMNMQIQAGEAFSSAWTAAAERSAFASPRKRTVANLAAIFIG